MKKQSNSLLMRTIAILSLLLAMVLVMTSCPSIPNPQDTPTSGPENIPEGPETGLYYYDNNGTEYTLKLHSGNKFELFNGATKTGTYTVGADGALSFTFAETADGTATAKIANDVVTFTYNNSETRFLRKIDYKVAFSTEGGSAIDAITVVNGKYATAPASPQKADYVFIGWYADAEYKTPFAFNTTPITSNITLYARWVYKTPGATEYTVSFEGAEVTDMTTIGGQLYNVPTPQKDGFTFGGWWTSTSHNGDELTALYKESDVFTADTTLYALWIAVGDKAPIVEVKFDGVSWNTVEGAIHYPVKITDPSGVVVFDDIVTGTTLAYNFTTAGKYKIEVSASFGTTNTAATVRYIVANALDRVDGLNVETYPIFTFNPVPNAEEYILTIVCGNPDHKHDALSIGQATTYNFAGCDMIETGITFTVTARAYGYADSVSKTYTCLRKLEPVTDLTVSNDVASWTAVENATDYEVEVTVDGSSILKQTQKDCSIDLKHHRNGALTISVKAIAQDYISAPATTYSYEKLSLATPSNLSVLGKIIRWDAVAGENISYIVNINGTDYTATTNSLNLDDISFSAQAGDTLEITVTCSNGNSLSVASDTLTVNYGVFGGDLTYKKNTLSWSAVVNMEGHFEVKVDKDTPFTVSGTSTPITFNKAGNVTVSVCFVSTSGSKSDTKTITLNVNTITFDSQTGSGVNNVYFVAGDYVTLPTNTTRLGYTFNNWYNSSDVNGKLIPDGIFEEATDVTLYAHWKANTYKVIYTVDETVDEVENGSTDDVVFDSAFQLATPTSDAGAFIGWYTGANRSGLQLTDDSGKSLLNWSIAEDTKVYPAFAKDVLEFVALDDGTWGVTVGTAINSVHHVIVPQTYQGKPVTVILENAFYKNHSMHSISIPNTIKVIGAGAFEEARGLRSIEVREIEGAINPIYSSYDGALIKNDLGTIYLEFVPRMKEGTLTIPENVDTIRSKAFYFTPFIEKVIISGGLSKIAEQAFYNCRILREIEFINEGTAPLTIENGAFYGTPTLQVIKFPARLASISVSTLNSIDSLSTVYVYDGGEHYGSTADGILTNGAKDTLLYVPASWKGEVIIPVGVTAIGEGAFANRAGVTSVTIPSWVTSIGNNAFKGASNLATVIIEGDKFDPLTIGEYAFAGCTSLTTLVINGGSSMDDGALVIGAYAFANNTKLTTPTISENANITSIGAYAFSGCSAISEVIIQNTTKTIGERAYAQCSNISKVSFAEGANVAFGSFVFEGCQKLGTISLPSTITAFDGSVFAGCNNIFEILVDTDNQYLCAKEGILYNKDVTTVLYCPKAKVVDFTTLPATVTKIGTAAFQANPSITTLTIPAGITEIGEMAFENCINLESVVFEGTADVAIGNSAFANCAKLATVTLPAGLTNISEKAFYLTAISSITIPETVTSIGAYAFAKTDIATLTIPASVTTIAEGAFSDCKELKTVTMNDGSANLQLGSLTDTMGVFEGSAAITTVTLPKRIQSIGSRAFYNAQSIKTMTIPTGASLETIGDYAFYSNKFNAIALPEGLTYIGSHAFENCQFTTVNIPTTVTEIGDNAFLSCSALQTVTFAEDGVASLKLNKEIFKNCSALTTVTLPARLDEAYEVMTTTAGGLQLTTFPTLFTGCDKLEAVYVEDGGEKYDDINGIFCEKANGVIVRVIFCPVKNPGDESKTVTIPYTVTQIDNGAFNGVSVITRVVFEDIPEWNGTPTLAIGNANYSGTGEDTYPVFKSSSIIEIDLPVQLKSLGFGAFHTMTALTTLSFDTTGAALDIVGQKAIYAVTALTSLNLPKIASLSKYAITENTMLATITLAPGSTLEEIPANAFYRNEALTAFVVPKSVKRIGEAAFAFYGQGTPQLASITFEEGSELEYIGDKAFSNLPLVSFTFPANVTTIGNKIFQSCTKLQTLTLNSTMKNLYASDGTSIVVDLTAIAEINVPESNLYLKVDDYGVLYSADGKQLIYCPPANPKLPEEYIVLETVTSIEDNAFIDLGRTNSIKTLILPEGLLRIGKNALQGSYLKSIHIPASVQEIGEKAFAPRDGITYLETVTFAENSLLVRIGNAAFSGCNKLTEIKLPDSVAEFGTGVGDLASDIGVFYGCAKLTTINLPAALTVLPAHTFSGCKALKTVNMNKVLEIIAGYAFYNCSALETVTLPASFRAFTGANIFANCSNLISVEFSKNAQVSDIPTGTFVNCPKLKSFTFPATIGVLNGGVFSNCPSIENIIIEGLITSIPDGMFKGMTSLTSITIPETVTVIGAEAFAGCANLTSFTIPAAVTEIGANAFAGCTGLKNIIVPEGVTKIGAGAFEGCTGLETITLPASLTEIGTAAFRGCTALTGVVIGANVTAIGDYAFENCTALASVEFARGNAIEMLGSSPFVESAIFRNTTALKSIVLPDSVKIIGANLFEGSGIESIQLPESLTAISEYAFTGCKNLKSLVVPDSVVAIYDYAFYDCAALTDVALGSSVESLGTAIFVNCTSLESLSIPASVKSIAGNIFINCPALTNITLDSANTSYVYENGMLMDADKFTLIYYSPAITTETPNIPSTIRVFAAGAFYGSQIQSLKLPETMTEIPDMMFMGSKKLKTINLPLSITKIGDKAFMGCEALAAFAIPETVTEIGEYAFAECTSLKTVRFAARKTAYTIGAHAFDGATSLTTLTLQEGLTALTPYMFANTGSIKFTLPKSVTNLNVEGVFYGSKMTTFGVADATVNVGDTLGVKFFMNCTALKSVTLPTSITRLGELVFYSQRGDTNANGVVDPIEATYFLTNGPSYAFAGCTSLASIDLSNIYWIGAHAFDGCTALTKVTFGKYLSVIGDYAFANCTGLTTLDFTQMESTWLNSSAQQKEQGLTFDRFQQFAMCSTEIGQYAFQNCSALTTITFKDSYSGLYWGTFGTGAFEGCTSLTQAGFSGFRDKYGNNLKNLPACWKSIYNNLPKE